MAGTCKMLLPIAGTKHHHNVYMKVSLETTISMLAQMYVLRIRNFAVCRDKHNNHV